MIKYKKNLWLAIAFTLFHGEKQRRVEIREKEREELRRKEGKTAREEERRIKKGRERDLKNKNNKNRHMGKESLSSFKKNTQYKIQILTKN